LHSFQLSLKIYIAASNNNSPLINALIHINNNVKSFISAEFKRITSRVLNPLLSATTKAQQSISIKQKGKDTSIDRFFVLNCNLRKKIALLPVNLQKP